MKKLTSAEQRALKARAHHLHPVVMVGDAGLTPAVLREIDVNLKSHELIKIRVFGDDRDARAALVDSICTQLDAAAVQHIGKILVIFRPRQDDVPAPENAAPGPAGKKTASTVRRPTARRAPRRTKRSFQSS